MYMCVILKDMLLEVNNSTDYWSVASVLLQSQHCGGVLELYCYSKRFYWSTDLVTDISIWYLLKWSQLGLLQQKYLKS